MQNHLKQVRQRSHKVIFRRIMWSLLSWRSSKCYIFCTCVVLVIQRAKYMPCILLSSMACQILYLSTLSHKWHDFWGEKSLNMKCVLWFALPHCLKHYLINGKIFRKKLLNVKCVLISSTLSERFLIRRIQQDITNVCVCMWSTHYSCQILTKLQFSQQTFEKYWNRKFHENPSSGSWVFPCSRTDMRKLILAFCNLLQVRKRWLMKQDNTCSRSEADEHKLWT